MRYRIGTTSITIIKVVVSLTLVAGIIAVPGLAYLLKEFSKKDKRISRRAYRESFNRLQKSGYIKVSKTVSGDSIRLTESGQKLYRSICIDEIQIKKAKMWNGKWYVVTFDIPERLKKSRDGMSIKLRDLGFVMVQKSIYIYPYNCIKEIQDVAEFFGCSKYVKYMIAEKVSNEEYLKNYFELN